MKSLLLFLLAFIPSYKMFAQHPVEMRNLWTRPQVHVLFEGYRISFAIKDINRSLDILREIGDSSHALTCGLDTAKDYTYELFSGVHTEYHHNMQSVLQNVVGAFLLTAGHAVVENSRHKILDSIIVDIGVGGLDEHVVSVYFYDPKTKKMLFEGRMALDMYKKDLGIDN